MQGSPIAVRQVAGRAPLTRVAAVPAREADMGWTVLVTVGGGLFFAAVADGLGVLLHLMGVMPLLP